MNVIIVSDHGMITTSPESGITRLELDDYLPEDADIISIADRGAYVNIKVAPESLESVRISNIFIS